MATTYELPAEIDKDQIAVYGAGKNKVVECEVDIGGIVFSPLSLVFLGFRGRHVAGGKYSGVCVFRNATDSDRICGLATAFPPSVSVKYRSRTNGKDSDNRDAGNSSRHRAKQD